MIERGISPSRRVVACRALRGREARLHVIRDIAAQGLRAVPFCGVAAVAIRRR